MKIVLVRRVDVLLTEKPAPKFPNFVAVSNSFAADEACIRWGEEKRAYPMVDFEIDFSKLEIVEHFGETPEAVQAAITEAQWYDKEILGL